MSLSHPLGRYTSDIRGCQPTPAREDALHPSRPEHNVLIIENAASVTDHPAQQRRDDCGG